MTLKILPQISVQPDWHEAVRDVAGNALPEDKFWVSIYKTGQSSFDSEWVQELTCISCLYSGCSSLHTSVRVKKSSSPRTAALEGEDNLSVQLINSVGKLGLLQEAACSNMMQRSFKIHYSDLDIDNAIVFSPRTEYVKIKGKAVGYERCSLRWHFQLRFMKYLPGSCIGCIPKWRIVCMWTRIINIHRSLTRWRDTGTFDKGRSLEIMVC